MTLELDGLEKAYGAQVALDGLDLVVRPGEVVGFVGPNGAGKTTAMRAVLGVVSLDAGQVRWQGEPVGAAQRRRFGYMPEERGLYPRMVVAEHLRYLARLHGLPAAEAQARTVAVLERLGVAARAGDRVEALSLGNQQRVQLAAALVHDPELLVLDEPFSGLDPVGVDALAAVLRQRVEAGAACVFSSHQLELVEALCDRVSIVSAGRVVASGTVADLRSGGSARVRVLGPPAAEWADGWQVVHAAQGETVVRLSEGCTSADVLDAARAAGPVSLVAPVEARLADLFRDVVPLGGGAADPQGAAPSVRGSRWRVARRG